MSRQKYSGQLALVESFLESGKLSRAQKAAQSLYDKDNAEEMFTEDEMQFIKVVIGLSTLDNVMKKLDKKGRKRERGDILKELMEYPSEYMEN